MVKMSKTEISAKILNQKFLLSESHQKLFCKQPGQVISFKPNMKQIHEAVQALESDMYRILTAILDFVGRKLKTL